MRTITTDGSKRSTCVTTFGHKIAIACDDGTVAVYDSVTGVLKLSLSPADPVRMMKGSQDGSVLFCTHDKPSITSWDIQTGGLIHTFTPERNVKDIAVSLKGHYLACRLLNGSIQIWDVPTKLECAPIEGSSLDTHLCWLEPEDQLAVAMGPLVRVWGVVSVKFLRGFTLGGAIYGMIYPPKLDRLIVVTTSTSGNVVNIIHPLHGLSPTPHGIQRQMSCFTFSQTTKQVVCGTDTDGLKLLNISTQCWNNLHYPDGATFLSSLPSGAVVANFASSGVQVLSLEDGHPTSQQSAISALAVRAFDQDKLIAILPTSRDRIVLLELAKMLQLLTIPAHRARAIPVDPTHILCASLKHRIAVYVYCSGESGREYLQLWGFGGQNPRWTTEIGGPPSIGGISPDGTRIVAFYDVDNQTCVCVWDAWHGGLVARLRVDLIRPLDITFDSDMEFYSHNDTFRVPFFVPHDPEAPPSRWSPRTTRTANDPPSSESAIPSSSITRREQQPLTGPPQRCYELDDTCEWVISGSNRICWIPPGYIGSVQPSYWWTGNLLVMAGQDGTIRGLTFAKNYEG